MSDTSDDHHLITRIGRVLYGKDWMPSMAAKLGMATDTFAEFFENPALLSTDQWRDIGSLIMERRTALGELLVLAVDRKRRQWKAERDDDTLALATFGQVILGTTALESGWLSSLAGMLAVSPRTMRRWHAGSHDIPPTVWDELLAIAAARDITAVQKSNLTNLARVRKEAAARRDDEQRADEAREDKE